MTVKYTTLLPPLKITYSRDTVGFGERPLRQPFDKFNPESRRGELDQLGEILAQT